MAKQVTATSTNVFTLASNVRADGTIPARVPATDHRHLKRCIDAGLIDADTLKITEAGIAAIREDAWHVTNREALLRLGVSVAVVELPAECTDCGDDIRNEDDHVGGISQ